MQAEGGQARAGDKERGGRGRQNLPSSQGVEGNVSVPPGCPAALPPAIRVTSGGPGKRHTSSLGWPTLTRHACQALCGDTSHPRESLPTFPGELRPALVTDEETEAQRKRTLYKMTQPEVA